MKEGWEKKKLREVCEVINGLWKGKKEPFMNVGVIRNANFTKDCKLNKTNIEFIDVEVSKFLKGRKLKYGDIIIERSGGGPKQPVGRPILFDIKEGDFSFSNFTSVLRIKDNNKLNCKYLQLYLFFLYKCGKTEQIQSNTIGLRNLDFNAYKEFEIPIPTLAIQQKIATYLDTTFAKLESIKAKAQQELEDTKELFQSELKQCFNNDSWEKKKLKDICDKGSSNISQKQLKEIEGEYSIYGASGFIKKIDFYHQKSKYISVIKDGSGVGRTMLLPEKSSVIGTLQYIIPKENIDIKFLYYLLQSLELAKYTQGAAIPHIYFRDYGETNIYVPNLQVQHNIAEKIETKYFNLQALETNYRRTISDCDELKQSILRKAFEGELTL